MPLSTYSPANKFNVSFSNSVETQANKERNDRLSKYGNTVSKLENRLQNMLNKSTHKGLTPENFFKSDNSIKIEGKTQSYFADIADNTIEVKRPETATEKLYALYDENKKNHSKEYVKELIAQIELFATQSNTLSMIWIQEELSSIILKSKDIIDRSNT